MSKNAGGWLGRYLGILITDDMMKCRRIKELLIGCGVIFGALTYWWLLPLRIAVETEFGTVLSLPTYAGDTFGLRFTHSVHRTPVWENFTVNRVSQMTLMSSEYQSYGVGMPSLSSEGTFTQQGDRFVLTNLNRKFAEIPLRVGPEAKLCLFHGDRQFPIYEWLNPGSLVHVRIKYDYLWFIPNSCAK